MAKIPSLDKFHRFYLLTWLLVALHVSTFTSASQYASPGTAAWTLATTATYGAFYLLPALLLGYVARALLGRFAPRREVLLAVLLIGLFSFSNLPVRLQLQLHKYLWNDEPGR